MRKIFLAFLFLIITTHSYGEEFKCKLDNGGFVNFKIDQNTIKYTYEKPSDSELVFSIANSEIKFYKRNFGKIMVMSLPYDGMYYEFWEENNRGFFQVRNKKGETTFKSYCVD